MKKRFSLLGALFAAVFCALIGSMLNTASAQSVTPVDCDQLKQQMAAFPVGSFGYQRLLGTYNNECQTIRPGCPSELDLTLAEKHCTDLGKYGVRYSDPSFCVQVKCADTPPSSSTSSSSSSSSSVASQTGPCPNGDMLTQQALACKANNQNYEYYTINGCRTVRCIVPNPTQTSCPSPDTLTNKAAACKARGVDYESYTDGVCKMIRCSDETVSQAACGTNADVNAAISACQNRGLTYKVTSDKNGCRAVQCAYAGSSASAESCPSNDDINMAINVCKNSGMTYTSIEDNSGCEQVTCQPFNASSDMFQFGESSAMQNESSSIASAVFPDVDQSTLQGQAAVDLKNRGIISGNPDGTFGGNNPVNRAEAAKFLLVACNRQSSAAFSGKFKDVGNDQWYTPLVEAAAAQGIISGYPDGTFKPGNTVNRAEFAKMITAACNLPTSLSYSFKDVSSSDWFSEFAGAVQLYNMFPNGPSTLMQPNKLMSRNDVATAIYQYLHH